MRRLDQLRVGERARVAELSGSAATKRRLLAMGLVPGVEVESLRVAPMGDPIVYEVKGYRLSLRREEAALVNVDPVVQTSLTAAPAGQPLVVSHVHGGWGLRRRLERLGLVEGSDVIKIAGGERGPTVVRIGGADVSLGHGVAERVFVQQPGEMG